MKRTFVLVLFCLTSIALTAQRYYSINSGLGGSKPQSIFTERLSSPNRWSLIIPVNFDYYSKKGFKYSLGLAYEVNREKYILSCYNSACDIIVQNNQQIIKSVNAELTIGYNITKKLNRIQLFPFIGFLNELRFETVHNGYDDKWKKVIYKETDKYLNPLQHFKAGIESRYLFKQTYVGASFFLNTNIGYQRLSNIGGTLNIGYILNK